ncbi:MAG: protein TolR [bacterium]|nr:MAG: protein TolR [bacterium]
MRRPARRFRRSYTVMSDINVTPFVDVMLVLLIIFMVTAPLARHGLEIKLPTAATKPIKKQEKWVITVYKNRKIYFNQKPVELKKLEEKLKEMVKADPAVEMFFKADKSLPYGYAVRVMAAVRRAGVKNLGMITEPVTLRKK